MSESVLNKGLREIRGFSSLSLRTQMLIAINVPLVLLVTVFLSYEFQREMSQRVQEKKIALNEEALAILPAVLQFRRQGDKEVQAYVDAVCAEMQDKDSPAHHIAITFPDQVIQATAHHRASPEMLDGLMRASRSETSRAHVGGDEIVVGIAKKDETTVFVSEAMGSIRRSTWNDLLRRVSALLILAAIGGVTLNVVLLRLVSAPLGRSIEAVRQIGAGTLGAQSEAASSAEMRFLADEINAMSQALAKADKYRTMQMNKAREIQEHLLPQANGIDELLISRVFEPADEVGGDFIDVIKSGSRVWICVADVTGHGISAAMSTMLLRSLLHTATELHESLQEILIFINRRLVDATLPGDFVTLFLVQIDLRSQRMEYGSAGHEIGVLLSPDAKFRNLISTGLLLGIDGEAEYETEKHEFPAGSRLALVTDGVTETHGPNGELFGQQRLVEFLRESIELPIDEVADQLNQELKRFRGDVLPHDDVTIVIVEMPSEQCLKNDQ